MQIKTDTLPTICPICKSDDTGYEDDETMPIQKCYRCEAYWYFWKPGEVVEVVSGETREAARRAMNDANENLYFGRL